MLDPVGMVVHARLLVCGVDLGQGGVGGAVGAEGPVEVCGAAVDAGGGGGLRSGG